ncbi:hypothetical protein MO867_15095 [Microbulbifer sp. OS29]|uniref:Uncharacterized protein n=1 Tax=Microbulbifer okhotskensis TaxID=2926617 RepID=A0A9X2ENT4_9GAMM|nr:hypothetical protein [Microbulbifer okhotskensis]MCO1335662.1 hypothetical protein [Microbulbifer okhotskensis]
MNQIVSLAMPGTLPSALTGVQDLFSQGGLRLSESQHSLPPEIIVASADGADT